MQGVHRIIHKGKEILFIDYEGCSSETEMIEILKKAQKIIIENNKDYLLLTNVKNTFTTSYFIKIAKQIEKETPKSAIKRAIVGIERPSRKMILQAYNLMDKSNRITPFDSLEDAKNWLIA